MSLASDIAFGKKEPGPVQQAVTKPQTAPAPAGTSLASQIAFGTAPKAAKKAPAPKSAFPDGFAAFSSKYKPYGFEELSNPEVGKELITLAKMKEDLEKSSPGPTYMLPPDMKADVDAEYAKRTGEYTAAVESASPRVQEILRRDVMFQKSKRISKALSNMEDVPNTEPNKAKLIAEAREIESELHLGADDFEKRALSGRATRKGLDDFAYGSWSTKKSQDLSTAIEGGDIQAMEEILTTMSQVEEAVSITLPESTSRTAKALRGAAGTAMPMGKSIALGFGTGSVGSIAYWGKVGQGEIFRMYLEDNGLRPADLTDEELDRAKTISRIGGSLYGSVELASGLVPGLKQTGVPWGDIVAKKFIKEAWDNPPLANKLMKGGIRAIFGWLGETAEEGVQAATVKTAISLIEGKELDFERDISAPFKEGVSESKDVTAVLSMLGVASAPVFNRGAEAKLARDLTEKGMDKDTAKEMAYYVAKGDKSAAKTLSLQYQMDVDPEVLEVQIDNPGLDYATAEYAVGAKKFGQLAYKKTEEEYAAALAEASDSDIQSLAEGAGIPVSSDRKETEAALRENPQLVRDWDRKERANLMTEIEESDIPAFEKQAYKWVAQGTLSIGEIEGLRPIFGKIAQEQGFEDIDAYFEAHQGEFTLPGRGESDFMQGGETPAIARNRFLAELKVGSQDEIGDGSPAFGVVRGIQDPPAISGLLDRAEGVAGRMDIDKRIEQARFLKERAKGGTRAQKQFMDHYSEVLLGEDRNEGLEWEIADDLKDELENVSASLEEYNNFDSVTEGPAHELMSAILGRASYPALAYSRFSSVWGSEWQGEAGIVGGLGAEDGEILSVATHEGMHGLFGRIESKFSSDMMTGEWRGKAVELARVLYNSTRNQSEKLDAYLNDGNTAADELVAMYMAESYNHPSKSLKGAADVKVEVLFRQAFGDSFVQSMREGRDMIAAQQVTARNGDIRAFYQREQGENADTIRGKTSFRPDGKFVVDLFKGGSVVTLAHEFAHVFSPHMSVEMVDKLIDRRLNPNKNPDMLGKSKAETPALRDLLSSIWTTFTYDPLHVRFANPQGADMKYLTDMQEDLATQFETYLATRSAPTVDFNPAFKNFAKRYREFYGAIRKLPIGQQRVAPEIAGLFDDMIAGEKALPRVEPRKVTVDGDTMTLHLSKPKEALRRKTLKALERVNADVVGLQDAVREYLAEAFDGKVPAALLASVDQIANNKEALTLMKKSDVALSKRELAAKKELVSAIKQSTRPSELRDMDPPIAKMIRDLLANIDLKPKTQERAREYFQLREAIRDRLVNNSELTAEDLLSTKSNLAKLARMDSPSIYNMSMEELVTLNNAIKDLIRYDDHRAEAFAKAEVARNNKLTDAFSADNKDTWQWRDVFKDRTERQDRNHKFFRRHLATSLENPSRMLEDLHQSGKDLYDNLAVGRARQYEVEQQFTDMLEELIYEVDLTGVSESLGPVAEKDMITVPMVRTLTGKTVERKFTKSQLMYMYGVSQNIDGLRHLLEGGVITPSGRGKFKGEEVESFKFTSPEAMITAFDQLPQELRNLVDGMMSFYRSEVAPTINDTSRDLLGVDIATIENYLPLAVEGRSRGDKRVMNLSQLGNKGRKFALEQVEHARFLQSRTGGDAPLYSVDLFDMVASNLYDVSEYVGMGRPLREATVILQPGTEGSTYSELAHIYGKTRADNLWKWVQALEDPSLNVSDFDRKAAKSSSIIRRGILKMKVIVTAMQAVSLNSMQSYLTEGGHRDMIASMVGSNGVPLKAKYSRKAMSAMRPELRHRFQGAPEVGIAVDNQNTRTQKMFGQHGGQVRRTVGKALMLGDSGLGPIKRADAWAISKIIETMERQQKRHGWSEGEMWDRTMHIINRTQPTSDPLHTSIFVGQPSNGFQRLVIGVYQSARDNLRGEVQTGVARYRKASHALDAATASSKSKSLYGVQPKATDAERVAELKDEKRRAAQQVFRASITSTAAVAAIRTVLTKALFSGGDDEENAVQDFMANFLLSIIGLDPVAGAVTSITASKLMDKYTGEISTPLLQQWSKWAASLGDIPDNPRDMDEYIYKLSKETLGILGSGWKSVITQTEKLMQDK
ncbi:hypothetical protein N9878_00380 [bacterium]|nr:hypothetical protein [bacterium]